MREVAAMALSHWGALSHWVHAIVTADSSIPGVCGDPMFLSECPKGIPFLVLHKNKKGNLIGCLRAGGFIKLTFKPLKAVILILP